MERVATDIGTGTIGALTKAIGGLLGCKVKFIFSTTGEHQFTYVFVENNGTKGVYMCLIIAVVFFFNY